MPDLSTASLEAAVAAASMALPVAVAYSGGADSSVLLHICARLYPGQVQAIHVHHGLQAAAEDFVSHAQATCAALAVPLHIARVDARHASGQSPEDAARRARYAALIAAVQALPPERRPQSMALAQHADDQVETLLIALSRGAGLPGLAAMPAHWERAGLQWHRPLLGFGAPDLRAWLQAQGHTWVEDPSNAELRYTRNHIRHELLPLLEQIFPQFRTTFTRSSAHAAEAQTLLQELAQQDLQQIGLPPAIKTLQTLSRARQANVLRYWLQQAHSTQASQAQLHELLRQVATCTTRGHRIDIKLGHGKIVRDGLHLGFIRLI